MPPELDGWSMVPSELKPVAIIEHIFVLFVFKCLTTYNVLGFFKHKQLLVVCRVKSSYMSFSSINANGIS